MSDCVFCAIVTGTEPAEIVQRWSDGLAIVPLNPVTPGHVLIIPNRHVERAWLAPGGTVNMIAHALEYASANASEYNLILNQGSAASQTIPHLHWHYVPRRPGDGLTLPWTGQVTP